MGNAALMAAMPTFDSTPVPRKRMRIGKRTIFGTAPV